MAGNPYGQQPPVSAGVMPAVTAAAGLPPKQKPRARSRAITIINPETGKNLFDEMQGATEEGPRKEEKDVSLPPLFRNGYLVTSSSKRQAKPREWYEDNAIRKSFESGPHLTCLALYP